MFRKGTKISKILFEKFLEVKKFTF